MLDVSTPKKKNQKTRTPQRYRNITRSTKKDEWYGLDLVSQGIKFLSKCLFTLRFLKELHLQNNELTFIPKGITELSNLEVLDISDNKLTFLPKELGRMIKLKVLKLDDNFLSFISMELGTLYQLETFSIDNNPLLEPFATLYQGKGGISVIHFCREHNTSYPVPLDRTWVDYHNKTEGMGELLSVASYNILSPHYATSQLFGYVPSWVLHWENRKEMIFQEIVSYNLDILGIQEMETYSFIENFKDQLDHRCNYDSLFYPSGRSQSLPESQKMSVDGCATFWKRHKFTLIDQQCVKFSDLVFTDERFCKNEDIMNRNSGKDNIVLITVLEKTNGGLLIISNAHIHWNPDYKDVKLFQTIILIEAVHKFKEKYPMAGIILLGDFNSMKNSAVYDLIVNGRIYPFNIDFSLYNYKPFSTDGFSHGLCVKDAYVEQELELTNFTAHFKGVLDYIFHNDRLILCSTLSAIDNEYVHRMVGLPSIHFPSDHILIAAKFYFKGSRMKKKDLKSKM